MRATFALIGVVLAASLVASQSCPAAPSSDPFVPTTCTGFNTCQATYCSCVGASANTMDCKPASTTSCTTLTTCLSAFNGCVGALSASRLNTTDSCSAFGTAIHQAQLAAFAGTFAGSALQTSCWRASCLRLNGTTAASSCSFGTNYSSVCSNSVILTTQSPQIAAAITAVLRLSGNDWAAVLNDPVKKQSLFNSLAVDIAAFLEIQSNLLTIIDAVIGSLVVTFSVAQGSGKTADQLVAGVTRAGTTATWLTSTKAVYATVSTEVLTVQSTGVTATGAPSTTTTGSGSTTTGSSATTTQAPAPTSAAPAASFVLAALLALAAILA
jgi:hypothetical protein